MGSSWEDSRAWEIVSGGVQEQGSVIGECLSVVDCGSKGVDLCGDEEGYCNVEKEPVTKKRKTMLRTMIDHLLVGYSCDIDSDFHFVG